ncbi:hypothetical protein [Neobacillus bataviensis]|uniref:hypothetical protein n=1 Tax=Neobacillus bataviensis TaxID=220685 RepID=UPI001CBEB9A4|nr:hypothetical protein [Neobacillus bataviensis]
MGKDIQVVKSEPGNNNTKNDIRVNNNFSLTINLGDSLNLLALIAGIYLLRSIAKKQNSKKE